MNAEPDILEDMDEDAELSCFQEIREHTLFKLKQGFFAVPVQIVREFLEVQDFTDIPEAPPHVLGLITVRDENIAVVDLALKLGMPRTDHTAETRIIVMEIPNEAGFSVIGAMVDSVVDVCVPEEVESRDIPDLGGKMRPDYIERLARYDDKTVMVLDACKIFSGTDLAGG